MNQGCKTADIPCRLCSTALVFLYLVLYNSQLIIKLWMIDLTPIHTNPIYK